MNTGHGKTTESARKPDEPFGVETGEIGRAGKIAKRRAFGKISGVGEPRGEKAV